MQESSPLEMNAFFEPAAAVAACKAEDIMTMPAAHLAQVAWPLLSDAERTLSTRDILFTPPMRVSASPRATESAFATGIQSCLTELAENLARVNCGDIPFSMARLRAAALAYHINTASKWGGRSGEKTASANVATSPLQLSSAAAAPVSAQAAESDAIFVFALPSFMPSEAAGDVQNKSDSIATSKTTAATRSAGAGRLTGTAIHLSTHNHPPDSAAHEAGTTVAATERAATTATTEPLQYTEASRKATASDTTGQLQDAAPSQRHSAADRENYERKTRSFVSRYVDTQWESVVASALLRDDAVNTTAKKCATTSAAAALRHKILRTALLLCHHAPTSAAAGHSFVCLLKHVLRAVATTDTIRCADGSISNVRAVGYATAEASEDDAVRAEAGAQPIDQKEGTDTPLTRLVGGAPCEVTSAPSTGAPATTAVGDSPSAAQPNALQLQANLWVEVALPLLHCVSLVRWTDDVLAELGRVLETVATATPPNLIALAQQQSTAATGTAGRRGESSRGAKCCFKKPPPSAIKVMGVSGSVEETVEFAVRVPFKIGLPKPAMTQEELLSALYHDANSGAQPGGQARTSEGDGHQPQLSLTNDTATSATGIDGSSYPSSAFHEVPDIRDEAEMTEEMSVVDEEEDGDINDDFSTTSGGSDASSSLSAFSPQTDQASALNVSVNSYDDDEDAGGAFGVLFGGPRGDFEAQPCRRRRTHMIEFSFPAATRVSVRFLDCVDWEHSNPRGRDVLLLPLESVASTAEKATTAAAEVTAPGAIKAKRICRDVLPLSMQSVRADRNEALTHNGPCRVAIPSLPQDAARLVPGEISAHILLTFDTRRATEWTTALSTAQRTIAERLLDWMEVRTQMAATDETQRRRSRVASCVLLRGGLKAAAEAKTHAAAAAAGPASTVAVASTAVASATAAPLSATGANEDAFVATLLEMPLAALRARVRCHTIHSEGVRATLLIIAQTFLQDRHGYLHGDPLSWHTSAWSEAVRRVSLASNVVGSAAVSGEAAMEVGMFFVRHVTSGCTASTATRAQVIDAAIDLMSIPGLSLADVKAALEDRRQTSSAMWIVVDLLTKCSSLSRAPKHVALVSQAVRRLLLLGWTSTQAVPPPALQHAPRPTAAGPPSMNASVSASTTAVAVTASMGMSVAPTATQANHYLSIVNGCGRATEINLRRGVHALLGQLFRLLKALLHRIQSTQAAPHRFLLESWEYGAFAVFTVSLMSAPLDAADVQLCSPLFADVVTGLLPSFTRLSRTESLLLTNETEEHKFLVEVARHVRGRASSGGVEGGGTEMSEVDTPASREPQVMCRVEETAAATSTVSTNGEGPGVWDVLQGATAASWTPGHVRVEVWNGSCSGFYIGLASANLPADVCGPERDPTGIYFMGDGTLQYGDVTRKQRRLPRWHAGDVVELSFVFANGGWDVVMALNEITMVRLTLPRRDFRLVAVNVRIGEYVPGHNHVHVLSVSPIYGKSTAVADKRQKAPSATRAATAAASGGQVSLSQTSGVSATTPPADVRLSPFSRLTVFNVSLFLELVLHYLVLHSSRQHYPSLATSVAGNAGAAGLTTSAAAHGGHHPGPRGLLRRTASSAALAGAHGGGAGGDGAGVAEGVLLVQACTAPLQHSLHQLVHLLHDLSHSENSSSSANPASEGGRDGGAEAYVVKRAAAQHITNAMLLDLVVTLSISLPASTSSLAMTVDVLSAVVECEAVARKTRTVALSALYNAITQHAFSEAISPVHSGAMRRLWAACYRLACEKPSYQPRFSSASVPPASVTVFAGGRRIEHRRVGGSAALSGNVRSVSYACNPIDLDDHETPEVVRVSVRLQRGFQCETLGRYYYFGLADVATTPASSPVAQGGGAAPFVPSSSTADASLMQATAAGELTKHPGERAKQRRTYYISDYVSEIPDVAVQKADVGRAKNYLNVDSNIIFGSGDIVTAVVYVRERSISFERNGLPLNVLYRNIPSSVHRLYPFVELYNRDSRAKWMYPPDEAEMSARYTMRAMLLTWPNAVLPLVKEYLPRFGSHRSTRAAADSQSLSTSLTRSAGDSCSKNASTSGNTYPTKEKDSVDVHDVVLGVLGADGDEMRMVYVAPPQLDQPGGRAQSVRVERFERGMAVVSDEAGSLLRVCAAALEPDTSEEVHVTPPTALRAAVQACLPELATFATQCLQELLVDNEEESGSAGHTLHITPTVVTAKREKVPLLPRRVSLHRPATLLRVLRLVSSLHAGTGAAITTADRSLQGTPQATTLSLGTASTTLTLAEPTERAMLILLPLLDTLLSAAQLDLPPSVLLREAWNELWCNPHLRQLVEITVPLVSLPGSASASSAAGTEGEAGKIEQGHGNGSGRSSSTSSAPSEELDYTFAEPAGITYNSSAQRFDDRLRGHQVDGDKRLCPSCGKRWSACTAHHTVPSSWCDLLDRVLRQLQRQSTSPSLKHAPSPYCGWFAEWTDGPLEESLMACNDVSDASSGGDDLHASSSPPLGGEDRAYHSPTSAQSSDAQLWEDADDTSEESGDDADVQEAFGEAGGAAHTTSGRGSAASRSDSNGVEGDALDDDQDDDEDVYGEEALRNLTAAIASVNAAAARAAEKKDHAPSTREEETPMTLVVRRAGKTQSAGDDDDDIVYVEGNGETRQASFTFTGCLVSPTMLRGQMTFDRIELPDAEQEPVANAEWACTMCTFLNEASAVRCAICANARPGASWTCPVCSYAYNTLSSLTCTTCGCMRPSGVRRLHEAAGPSGYCTKCHEREHFRNFHAMRYRRFCATCGTVTRWLPKDKYSTTIEARLVGDGGMLEFQWALDGCNTVCFGLRTSAFNADRLWALVDAAARRRGSSAVEEVGRCVPPIPERPLSTPSSRPIAALAAPAALSAAAQPCMVGAIIYYASALVLRYARLLPVAQLADPGFLRRLHVCGPDWLDSWAHFPTSAVVPIFTQCLKLLQDGVRQPELVSTIATVALALIRQQPRVLGAEKHALLYALCLNVVRYGDAAQRKVSYASISALMEDDPATPLNVQPLVPVLSMEPLLEGQQRATVLALLHHASMPSTPAIAKACACMARTVESMEHQRPLPPMLGKPFPYLVALTETRLNEGGELLVGQVRGSVGVAPTKGGKYYYEVEVPHEFVADRTKTIVMGWGTVEHERIASAQHVGSDLHSWGFNCREHLRLMMTEQALPVPRRPNQGDVIGSMMDLGTMMVCWTINGQEISWVSVPAQGDGEEIFPYVSASVEPQSVKIRLGNTRFKPAGYQDYTPPSDRNLWAKESGDASGAASVAGAKKRGSSTPYQPPISYEFYQQLSLALEEASITTLDDASLLSLLDTTTARSVLRQYPRLVELMCARQHDTAMPLLGGLRGRKTLSADTRPDEKTEEVQLLLPYIQRLRRTQDLTIVVARHLSLIEKSPYLMTCYKKATDLLFSSGRWTIFELQPGGRPKYSGGHAFCVLVSVRKAKRVRKEADAEWLLQHPSLAAQQHHQSAALASELSEAPAADEEFADAPLSQPMRDTANGGGGHSSSSSHNSNAFSTRRAAVDEMGNDEEDEEEEEEYVDVDSDDEDEDDDDEGEGAPRVGNMGPTSFAELRNALQEAFSNTAQISPEERRLRCSVTGQLFTQLEKTRVYQRARMFAVQLEGTLAVDAGGVTRAVMSMVGEELSYRFVRGVRVDPLLPLFQLCSHSTIFTVVPNMSALYASEAADDGAEGGLLRRMFTWLGKLIGNMVLCGTLKVPFDFPRMLWKTLTFQEDSITLSDYAYDIDDNITAALEDDEFVLSEEFFAALPEHVRASPAFLKSLQGSNSSSGGGGGGEAHVSEGGAHHAAMSSTRALRPYVCMTPAMSMQDMSHLALEELEEFAADAEAAEVGRRRALAQEALLHQYDPAFLAMRAGLTSVVPASSLRSVRWEDLRARVCGNGAASTEHVLAELDMSPLSPSMRVMLTQVLNNFTESQLSRFLLFCSGQSRIPLPEKVLVNCGDEAGRLPTAHTCSPISLLLQPCSTAAQLQNSLEACLTHASEFGFV